MGFYSGFYGLFYTVFCRFLAEIWDKKFTENFFKAVFSPDLRQSRQKNLYPPGSPEAKNA
jgi:hypothetical protein